MSTHIHGRGKDNSGGDYVRVSSDDPPIRIGTDDSTVSIRATKVCCVCGEDVADKPRMKDHGGRYWCYECGIADQHKKQSMAGGTAVHPSIAPVCPECRQETASDKLVEFGGRKICALCADKLERSARRETARLAAAEVESARMVRNQRLLMLILAGAALAAVVLAIARLL